MNKQLRVYLDKMFAPHEHLKGVDDLKEELGVNLSDKYDDYKQSGYADAQAFKLTIDSIGDVSELLETIDPEYKKERESRRVLPTVPGPLENGIMAAYVYAILFVALMVVLEGTITGDSIVMPAVILLGVVSLVQYLVKGNSMQPRWLVVGSFVTGVLTAVVMAIILH